MVPHFRVPWRVSFGFNLIAVLISLMAKSSDGSNKGLSKPKTEGA